MAGQIFIGTLAHMRNALCPLDGMTSENSGYTDTMRLAGGGAVAVRSAEYHKVFNLSFSGPVKAMDGIAYYNQLASGYHGAGLIYFTNPYDRETNTLAAGWASPGLAEQGWQPIADPATASVTFSDVEANTFNQPSRAATYALTMAAGTAPDAGRYRHVVTIPPGDILILGASGSAEGAGAVIVRPVLAGDGIVYGSESTLDLLSPSGATRFSTAFDGATYKAVEIYLGRTADVGSAVTIVSMIAQLWAAEGAGAPFTGPHVQGEGHGGCMFNDDAVVEKYIYINPPRKGISTTLLEVGPWQR